MDKFEFADRALKSFQGGVAVTSRILKDGQGSDAERNQLYKAAGEYLEKLGAAVRKAMEAVGHLNPGERVVRHHIEDAIGPFLWLDIQGQQGGTAPALRAVTEMISGDLRELLSHVPLR